MPKFHGIKIEATGQNIITLGDGNQINAKFGELGEALAELRDAVTQSAASEAQKMELVADVDTIQSQLAKPEPNRGIVKAGNGQRSRRDQRLRGSGPKSFRPNFGISLIMKSAQTTRVYREASPRQLGRQHGDKVERQTLRRNRLSRMMPP
jgi:hypothetical protein